MREINLCIVNQKYVKIEPLIVKELPKTFFFLVNRARPSRVSHQISVTGKIHSQSIPVFQNDLLLIKMNFPWVLASSHAMLGIRTFLQI